MATVLVVTAPFGAYQRGDVIDEPGEAAAVLASENAEHVVKRAQPDGEGGETK